MHAKKVVIGIQARSTSTRLPNKISALINGRSVLDRVLLAAQKCASFINNGKGDIMASVALLVPTGDPIANKYRHKVALFEGSESDVLSRYLMVRQALNPDYMVRITADCPLLIHALITKHIVVACKHNFDYVLNCDPDLRASPDGLDVEVISARLLDWIGQTATTTAEREHVTFRLRSNKPEWARAALIIDRTDQSHLKLSVDTEEDLEFARIYDKQLYEKDQKARAKYDGVFQW